MSSNPRPSGQSSPDATGPTAARLSRRQLLSGIGAGAVAAAAGVPAAGQAIAKDVVLTPEPANARRAKLGAFELITAADGYAKLDKVHPIFGQNQPAKDVAELLTANFLPADKMSVSFTPAIVDTGKEKVLFDAGNGAGRGATRGVLTKSIQRAGLSPDDITLVVITHYHPDHIGGLMTDGAPTFKNARYVAGETEHNYWSSKQVATDPKMAARLKVVNENVTPLVEKFRFIKAGEDVVTGITAIDAFGHTPGHLGFNIESNGHRLVLWADACNHYVASMQKPEWHVVFDMDKDAAIRSRKKMLGMAAADKIPAHGYHMPFPALGYVEEQSGAFNWVPVSYQLDF